MYDNFEETLSIDNNDLSSSDGYVTADDRENPDNDDEVVSSDIVQSSTATQTLKYFGSASNTVSDAEAQLEINQFADSPSAIDYSDVDVDVTVTISGNSGDETVTLESGDKSGSLATDTSSTGFGTSTTVSVDNVDLSGTNSRDYINVLVDDASGTSGDGSVTIDTITYTISNVDASEASLGSTGGSNLGLTTSQIQADKGAENNGIFYKITSDSDTSAAGTVTAETGYGFTVAASFEDSNDDTSDGAERVDIGSMPSSSFVAGDDVFTTQHGAEIQYVSGSAVDVVEESDGDVSGTLRVNYQNSGEDLDSIAHQSGTTGIGTLGDEEDGESSLTNRGTAVELSSDSSATITYSDEQRDQLTAFGSVGEGSGEGEVMTPSGWPSSSAAVDEEASTDQDLVLVGGPLVNDLTADLADQGSTWNSTQYENNQGVGVLDLVNDAFDGNNALVVAGWQAEDTSAAAEYLVENAGAEELEGRTTVQVDTESGELVQ